VGFDPNSGNFTGLPKEWKSLLESSNISKEEMSKNPQAVLDVLEFYTDFGKDDDDTMVKKDKGMPTPAPPRPPQTIDKQHAPPKVEEEELFVAPPQPKKKKEPRMSTMTEVQIMDKLKSVVSTHDPIALYARIKKVGQGASGSVVCFF